MEKDFEKIIKQLQSLVGSRRSLNYSVTYEFQIFNSCTSIEDFKLRLKKIYPETNPETVNLLLITEDVLWEAIDEGLNYGIRRPGEKYGEGFELADEDLIKYRKVLEDYKGFVKQLIKPNTTIFSYPDDTNITYDVFWGYHFVLFTDNNCVFLVGSSSD